MKGFSPLESRPDLDREGKSLLMKNSSGRSGKHLSNRPASWSRRASRRRMQAISRPLATKPHQTRTSDEKARWFVGRKFSVKTRPSCGGKWRDVAGGLHQLGGKWREEGSGEGCVQFVPKHTTTPPSLSSEPPIKDWWPSSRVKVTNILETTFNTIHLRAWWRGSHASV